jgi:8-oxo-dGTP pyrophosphatase MutT (NUDIX family)
MLHEKSVGVVPFHAKGHAVEYLLLHYPSRRKAGKRSAGHWDFPKGHVEKGETELATAARELEEETGIPDAEFVHGFREIISFFFRSYDSKQLVKKKVVFYLAEAKSKKTRISWEHVGYEWLPYEKALEKLTFKNAKNVLGKAHAFLASGRHGTALGNRR